MEITDRDYVTLKWGTLKSWNITTDEGKKLLHRYFVIGSSLSAMAQRDTTEQKEIICKLIDLVPGEIYLEWDDGYVSKDYAKKYVMEYMTKSDNSSPNHSKVTEA